MTSWVPSHPLNFTCPSGKVVQHAIEYNRFMTCDCVAVSKIPSFTPHILSASLQYLYVEEIHSIWNHIYCNTCNYQLRISSQIRYHYHNVNLTTTLSIYLYLHHQSLYGGRHLDSEHCIVGEFLFNTLVIITLNIFPFFQWWEQRMSLIRRQCPDWTCELKQNMTYLSFILNSRLISS